MSDHEQEGFQPFEIMSVHEGRTPAKEPPFHSEGGDWLFLECRAGDEEPARFTVGVLARDREGRPLVWGKAWLAVADREDGARLVRLLADAFRVDEPPLPERQYPLEPWLIRTANLDDLRRNPGGEAALTDAWSSNKWFLEHGRFSAEVYFNFNLALRRGAIAEKDPEDGEDLLRVLATALRDGRRPPRTPETDGRAAVGPRVAEVRTILHRRSDHFGFTPGGRLLVYADGNALRAIRPAAPEDPVEIARFENPLWEVFLADEAPDLLVVECLPQDSRGMSTTDPVRVWWVDGLNGQRKLLLGPQTRIGLLPDRPVSPDCRFVALTHAREIGNGNRHLFSVVYLIERETGAVREVTSPGQSLTPVGWRGEGQGLRAVLLTNRWQERGFRREAYLAHPATGVCLPDPEAPTTLERLGVLSPDGRYLAKVVDEERLVLTDLASGSVRMLAFPEEDFPVVAADSVKWVGFRHLQIEGSRPALIDADTLTIHFPFPEDGEGRSSRHCFSPDLAWVAFEQETLEGVRLCLGCVVMPPG